MLCGALRAAPGCWRVAFVTRGFGSRSPQERGVVAPEETRGNDRIALRQKASTRLLARSAEHVRVPAPQIFFLRLARVRSHGRWRPGPRRYQVGERAPGLGSQELVESGDVRGRVMSPLAARSGGLTFGSFRRRRLGVASFRWNAHRTRGEVEGGTPAPSPVRLGERRKGIVFGRTWLGDAASRRRLARRNRRVRSCRVVAPPGGPGALPKPITPRSRPFTAAVTVPPLFSTLADG